MKRVGRGSGLGKGNLRTREKGAGSRSGYKRRCGYEGGQFRMFMKLPVRGFSNDSIPKVLHTVNFAKLIRCITITKL